METKRIVFPSRKSWFSSYLEAHAEDGGEIIDIVFNELEMVLELYPVNRCFYFKVKQIHGMIYSVASEKMGDSLAL